MKFFSTLLFSSVMLVSSSAVHAIPLGKKYPPDLILREGNSLLIPPDFEVDLPYPGEDNNLVDEREIYKKEIYETLFPPEEPEIITVDPEKELENK